MIHDQEQVAMDLHFSSDVSVAAELPPEAHRRRQKSSVDDHRSSIQYSNWLQRLTINAVGRALQCLSYLTTVLIQSNYHAKAKSCSKHQSELLQDKEELMIPRFKDGSIFHFMKKFPSILTLSPNNNSNGKRRSLSTDSEDQIRSVQTIQSLISSSPLQDRSFLQSSAKPHSMKSSSAWPIQHMHQRSLSCSPKHRGFLQVWKRSPRSSFLSEENDCKYLDMDSEERCHITAKIIALLLQWHNDDQSQEWRSQVMLAAEMFQEAIYQQFSNGDGNTINQALLESQLLYVLRHFEAGNGICLLMRSEPVHPLRPACSHSSNDSSAVNCIPDNGASKEAIVDDPNCAGKQVSPTFGSLVQVEVRGAQLRMLGQYHSGRGRICVNKLNALTSSMEEEEEEEEDKTRSELDCCRLVTTLVTTKLKYGNDWRFSAPASALRESPSSTAGGRRLQMKAGFWFGCGMREMKIENEMVEESAVEFSTPESQSSAAGLPSTEETSSGCLLESAASTNTAAINPNLDRAAHQYLEEDSGDEITAAEEEGQQQQQQEEEDSRSPLQEEMQEAEHITENAEQSTEEEHDHHDGGDSGDRQGVNSERRVSLMMLMMRQESGLSSRAEGEVEAEVEADWERWEEPTEQLDPHCCICMVGLKGCAFVPCGHTFCRRCSRELWRNRGTCPLCNLSIRQILDIY